MNYTNILVYSIQYTNILKLILVKTNAQKAF